MTGNQGGDWRFCEKIPKIIRAVLGGAPAGGGGAMIPYYNMDKNIPPRWGLGGGGLGSAELPASIPLCLAQWTIHTAFLRKFSFGKRLNLF